MIMNKRPTALIAEDDEISFELYKIKLKDLFNDLEILRAANGKEAVDFIKAKTPIDLILMDIRMPILDGYKATKQIREIDQNIPIVAQTAFAAIPEHKEMLEMGFNDFLEKPIKNDRLEFLVNKYIH